MIITLRKGKRVLRVNANPMRTKAPSGLGDPLRGDCGTYALALAELNKKKNPKIIIYLREHVTTETYDPVELLRAIDGSEIDMVHVAVQLGNALLDAEGAFSHEKAQEEYEAEQGYFFDYNENKKQLGTVIRNNTNFTSDWPAWKAFLKKPKKNPLRGEWWIDDSGNAQFADGNVGDMNHEMIVIDGLARDFLGALDIDANDESYGTLDNYDENIAMVMKEEGLDPESDDPEEFVSKKTRHLFPKGVRGDRQHDCALATVYGRSDARNYGLEFQGWIRVHGNNIQTHDMNKEIFDRIGEGIYAAAGGEELDIENEFFNIEVNKTGKFYRNVPLEVINAGDPGDLRLYEE